MKDLFRGKGGRLKGRLTWIQVEGGDMQTLVEGSRHEGVEEREKLAFSVGMYAERRVHW